ncbi:MAG: hypothetical protein JXQ93_05430 [Flavobacteriaceae bacterium]
MQKLSNKQYKIGVFINMNKIWSLLFFFAVSISVSAYNGILLKNTPFHFTKAQKINKYTTRIPFKLVDRLIVIEGELKGKKGEFIFDTGSEKLLINKVHFSKLILHDDKISKTSGILDYIDNPIQKRIQQFSLKNLLLSNKKSDLIDLSHIEKAKKIKILGIIGYNILKDYEVFVDLYLNQITLTQIDKNGNVLGKDVYLEKIEDSISFHLKKHAIILDGFINKRKAVFALDSGAEFNQLNNRSHKKALKYFYPKGRVVLKGASNKKLEVISGNLFRVRLSKTLYFGPMKTILTSFHNIDKAFGAKLDGILGYDFFAQKRTIINYKKQKLYFIKYPIIRK